MQKQIKIKIKLKRAQEPKKPNNKRSKEPKKINKRCTANIY